MLAFALQVSTRLTELCTDIDFASSSVTDCPEVELAEVPENDADRGSEVPASQDTYDMPVYPDGASGQFPARDTQATSTGVADLQLTTSVRHRGTCARMFWLRFAIRYHSIP